MRVIPDVMGGVFGELNKANEKSVFDSFLCALPPKQPVCIDHVIDSTDSHPSLNEHYVSNWQGTLSYHTIVGASRSLTFFLSASTFVSLSMLVKVNS